MSSSRRPADLCVESPYSERERVCGGGDTRRRSRACTGFVRKPVTGRTAACPGLKALSIFGHINSPNRLYGRGALSVSDDRRYLHHEDGTPFFWLGDTWWMGLTKRLRWPEDFQELAADRVAKGFNVVQIVGGLYPDQGPFDPRGANEAGFPWDQDFTRINPAWWDHADLRIHYLVETGPLPCILGS